MSTLFDPPPAFEPATRARRDAVRRLPALELLVRKRELLAATGSGRVRIAIGFVAGDVGRAVGVRPVPTTVSP
jgi:3-dehydroquinate synthetase